ncbi:MAG: nucleotide sugar dehydrogenase [Deltaproteobacteria bacterium]|nr:MAG: nucleotide sugar dehydrogenase [Deltaproteobacteria bacterium]
MPEAPTPPSCPAPAERVAVLGLGYVGLPVALAFGRAYHVVGFDIDARKVALLREGVDPAGQATADELRETRVAFTSDERDLRDIDAFVVAVPTPIDTTRRPDLSALRGATEIVGRALKPGAVVVYESTVYPGVTEEVCAPLLEQVSGLRAGVDFHLAYSPERINPGDAEHTFERIQKVVAGDDAATVDRVAALYGRVVTAGVFRAASIKVAEAAKVLENTQRDLNIALMNEFAIICDRLGIRTRDVLDAAATKWNFLRFSPGLVGGHCIGVDPYYLTTKAEELGYHPEVILAGRRINDNMGVYVAGRLIKLLARAGAAIKGARIGVLGLAFKENVGDVRNSRVPDICAELAQFGAEVLVHDPLADRDEARRHYGIALCEWDALRDLDAVVLAVPHAAYLDGGAAEALARLRPGGVVVDVKSALDPAAVPAGATYWSL